MKRCIRNPLITIEDVKPSREGLRVEGIFNCGVCRYQDEILLVCRVSESAGFTSQSVKIPIMVQNGSNMAMNVVEVVKAEHPEWDFSDSRSVRQKTPHGIKTVYLTSFSHLRLARSRDGINFTVSDSPMVQPVLKEESWGMEDPRVTRVGDTYYINYTAVSPQGPATALLSTKNFVDFKHCGVIFAPENKDVVIFPEKFGDLFYALNRPVSEAFGTPEMWICESPDMIHWGNQRHFCSVSGNRWESGRIGGGAVPFRTEKGWIEFYHAADENNRYCIGAMLLEANHPEKILARTENPVFEPEIGYETSGFFGDAVFTCGCYQNSNKIVLYYGAADDKICRVDFTLEEIYRSLKL
ncbi:glycosidase [Clostridium sp. W14A]|uniref:Glycoside hydrolase family 130 protein n=1 Tax=Caproicibacter fermentans TaxID=2576756 RepID=A0A7G8TDQ7_9FIRM|nr:glycoside hydrolase family 130 protein [Caproicibacter fermentans]OCN00803.1 glycosidase [Clostridium sp. W14A]QNK41748.1 glycoside hydrolase family 130 protein [Caproicibacter fermentans]